MPVTPKYTRRTPEESILHNAIAKHWPWLRAERKAANDAKGLANFIERAVNAYLACGKGSGIDNFLQQETHLMRIVYYQNKLNG